MADLPSQPPVPTQAFSGCFVRVFWMIGGNIALGVTGMLIARNHDRTFSKADIAYWAIVACLFVVRYVDVYRLKGQTATGNPATPQTWKRYVALLLVVALVVWGLAHAAGRFLA